MEMVMVVVEVLGKNRMVASLANQALSVVKATKSIMPVVLRLPQPEMANVDRVKASRLRVHASPETLAKVSDLTRDFLIQV
jgi:hypothetical protein